MKISMWTQFLHGLTLEQMAQTFAEHGFECAELSSEHAGTAGVSEAVVVVRTDQVTREDEQPTALRHK